MFFIHPLQSVHPPVDVPLHPTFPGVVPAGGPPRATPTRTLGVFFPLGSLVGVASPERPFCWKASLIRRSNSEDRGPVLSHPSGPSRIGSVGDMGRKRGKSRGDYRTLPRPSITTLSPLCVNPDIYLSGLTVSASIIRAWESGPLKLLWGKTLKGGLESFFVG